MPFDFYMLQQFANRLIQYLSVQEDDGVQGLALGGRKDLAMCCQMTEKRFDLDFTHVPGMHFGVEVPNETHNPLAITLYGTIGIMVVSQHLPDLLHELQIGVWAKFLLVSHEKYL